MTWCLQKLSSLPNSNLLSILILRNSQTETWNQQKILFMEIGWYCRWQFWCFNVCPSGESNNDWPHLVQQVDWPGAPNYSEERRWTNLNMILLVQCSPSLAETFAVVDVRSRNLVFTTLQLIWPCRAFDFLRGRSSFYVIQRKSVKKKTS